MNTQSLGVLGEDLAADYLVQKHGWQVLARRVRFREGEIDLIMLTGEGRLVFVEVKARKSFTFGAAVESVMPEKVRKIRRAIGKWRAQSGDFREGELLLVTMEWRGGVLTVEEVGME
jgi:putative endonuclease